MTDTDVTRRTALVVAGSGLGAATLAACGSTAPDHPTVTAAGGSTGVTSATASSAASTSPAASSAANSGAAGKTIVALSQVPVGGAVSATGPDGQPMIVAQPTKGQVVGLSAKCTHMGCTVKPAGKELDCPCHGSRYDAATGKVLRGPAPAPLPPIRVTVVGDSVVAKG